MNLDTFWKNTGPFTPWGPFNLYAGGPSLNFTWDAARWLATAGVGLTLNTLQSRVVILDPKILVVATSFNGTKMTARLERNQAVAAEEGDMVEVSVEMVASDTQHDERSYYLRLEPR